MQLEQLERDVLHRVLSSAIADVDTLDALCYLKLGPNLESISKGAALPVLIMRVIRWSDTNGKQESLITGALELFKDNSDVQRELPLVLKAVQTRSQQEINRAAAHQLPDLPAIQALVKDVQEIREMMRKIAPTTSAEAGRNVVRAGARALEKIHDAGEKASLTEKEQLGLEAIILMYGRPALLVKDGDFAEPPDEWNHLAEHRDAIRRNIAGVGRLEIDGEYEFVGTGFLGGSDVVVTSRHVAQMLAQRRGAGWALRKGNPRIDFLQEYDSKETAAFPITKVIGIDEKSGVGLFRVRKTATGGAKLPAPLPLVTSTPRGANHDVYVVGYPAYDSRKGEMNRIFGNLFGVKRLCPGKTTSGAAKTKGFPQSVIAHDCSTAGGMAGAPLIDLRTNQVIGVHFAAQHLVAGYATRIVSLLSTPLAKEAKLRLA